MDADAIALADAAERLGVHYQTAYKWVRTGRLPAVTVGGRYRIRPTDLDRFAAKRLHGARPRARRPRHGFDELADRAHRHLVAGEELELRRLVAGLVEQGVSLTTTVQEILVPALRRIGEAWHAGDLGISVEHRASAIIERLLGEHFPTPRGRRRGTAVVAALAGDRHALPTSMAAAALREDNWHVHHLGADVPGEEIHRFCADHPVDLVVLTVTDPAIAGTAAELAERFASCPEKVLVGAPGATLTDLRARARAGAGGS